MYKIKFLKEIRAWEANLIAQELTGRGNFLEIGAGSGWQTNIFHSAGFNTFAIDILDSNYHLFQEYPVILYDGLTLPFEDDSFDYVYSSNVLEHVRELPVLLKEIHRVCKPQGCIIHFVPSSSWRFWTNITYYVDGCKILVQILLKRKRSKPISTDVTLSRNPEEISASFILKNIFPPRHGENGNFITEIFHFSKRHWIKTFKQADLTIVEYKTNDLFYTGYSLIGRHLSLTTRQYLSKLIGSACHVFILSN